MKKLKDFLYLESHVPSDGQMALVARVNQCAYFKRKCEEIV